MIQSFLHIYLTVSLIALGLPVLAQDSTSVYFAQHPVPLKVRELTLLNSVYRETNLTITPDGRYLYFMSSRGEMPWSVEGYTYYKGTPRYDGDIWFSEYRNGAWSKPVCMPATVNSAHAEDEPNISPDGNYVMFQSWRNGWFGDGGPYYMAELYGHEWGKPEGLKGGINQYFKQEYRKHEGYATDGATLSPDQNLFMVAVAPGYEDSMDIIISQKKESGIWGYPQHAAINTEGDDRSLFLAADNRTLYFASDGYPGYGGLDIFKTTYHEDGSWGEVVNIGVPFNTPEDDYNFIITADGNTAFFVREGNIHTADVSMADPRIKPLPSVQISGVVYDMYGRATESSIEVHHDESRSIRGRTKSNAETGAYALSFFREPGRYTQTVTSEGLKTSEQTFRITDGDSSLKITRDVELIEPNMVLIQFEFDKSLLKDAYIPVLDSLADLLYQNRKLRLLIAGHTDETGTEAYNLELSKDRVFRVGNYLQSKGIPAGIMRLDYFGETMPKVKHGFNKDAINRRVEIKIIELKR